VPSRPDRLVLFALGLSALAACDSLAPPPQRDASDTARDVRPARDLEAEASDDDALDATVAPDVPPPASCAAFFNAGSAWDGGFSGQVFFEYGGPPITSWEVRIDFGFALDLKGAWSGSGLLLDDPIVDGTAIVIGLRLEASSGQRLGVELRRFDVGLSALYEPGLDLDPPSVALDGIACGDLQ